MRQVKWLVASGFVTVVGGMASCPLRLWRRGRTCKSRSETGGSAIAHRGISRPFARRSKGSDFRRLGTMCRLSRRKTSTR